VFGGGEGLGQHASTGHLDRLLLEVSDDGVFRERDASLVCVLTPGDDLEQRRLACAVWPDQSHSVAHAHAQNGVREEHASAKCLGDIVDREDHSRSV